VKELTCIVCPNGCRIRAEWKDGGYTFEGNRCAKGAEFALAELVSPMRSVTTTVRTVYPDIPALPVRTKGEVPKEMIPKIISALAGVKVSKRLGIGETVVENILGSGCDVIATDDMLK
jgi:CxxC motif-containing protein